MTQDQGMKAPNIQYLPVAPRAEEFVIKRDDHRAVNTTVDGAGAVTLREAHRPRAGWPQPTDPPGIAGCTQAWHSPGPQGSLILYPHQETGRTGLVTAGIRTHFYLPVEEPAILGDSCFLCAACRNLNDLSIICGEGELDGGVDSPTPTVHTAKSLRLGWICLEWTCWIDNNIWAKKNRISWRKNNQQATVPFTRQPNFHFELLKDKISDIASFTIKCYTDNQMQHTSKLHEYFYVPVINRIEQIPET
ncbi:hypothetical protein MAR_037029 [Mya arenaria]|uniref:Uncharacterized protein n=1 Tax=Mya arenaria TaxID=6604 RepID=A0ABY7FMD7_MYAAR|nr:hypothetical protein MAR_037029 [Mya arenaria]